MRFDHRSVYASEEYYGCRARAKLTPQAGISNATAAMLCVQLEACSQKGPTALLDIEQSKLEKAVPKEFNAVQTGNCMQASAYNTVISLYHTNARSSQFTVNMRPKHFSLSATNTSLQAANWPALQTFLPKK